MNNGIVYSMTSVIPIGYVGENETREIAIDIRPLVRAWPDLAPVLLAKRPGENALYPCVTHVENGVLYWRVTLSDTAIPGKGECVIHMIDGEGRVGKSRTMTTLIERSASGEETQEPPEAIKPWIDDVLASIESVKEGYIEIEQGEENAGLVLAVGEDGRVTLKKGGAGGDGVGVESVEQTQESLESGGENVWTLRLTDGTTSRLIVRNGAQGPTGPAGMNGVSPTVTFGRIEGGYRLSIVDATGTHSAEIMDGADGPQGPEGPRGIQGPAGERGEQGERGAPFAIAKIYSSIANMNAGYASDGVAVGGFVLIETGDVNDEENARLYVKGESRYEYVTDLSGAPGIQGPEGKQGPQGPAGNPGAAGADGKDGTSVTIKSVSESSADGGSNVVTFGDGKTLVVKNGKTGAQGPTGPTGATGPAGPAGPAGADGKDGAQGPAGPAGPAGSDATVTATSIQAALGYKPASEASVSQLSEKKADKFDPTVYGLPILYLTGDTTGMSKDVAVTLDYAYGDLSGSCTLKWQGSSSLSYDKKNYTIKLDTAVEMAEGWGAQKKYCLKANYIDHTHARNIVSARLWGKIVESRRPLNTTLKACPNWGAVDGFPIVIMLNGEFHGLYTWNIPKDMWMFNMGSGTQEAIICANYDTPAVDLRVHAKVDGSDHELEEVTDEDNADWVATSLNNVIDLCVNSYGADLDTTIAQYLDWESAIDYYIWTVIMDGRDMTQKNYIMATWNGTKWVFSAYDMDSTYGLDWNGAALLPPNDGVTFEKFRRNRVMELVYRFKTNALKARYKALRESVLSEYAINTAFENFGCGIPSVVLDEDVKKWPSIPSTSVNTTDQILRWLHHRLAIADKWIDEIPAQETPVAPAAREGNVVPVSITSAGVVYNGTGYKNGFTINSASDGTESEVAMDGCCITGFIPVTKNNVIKVTTDGWNISPTNSRVIFYNSSFKPMAYYTQHGFVGLFNGYTNATAIMDKTEQSVTYGSDGMTTLNIAYGANCTDLRYVRIRAVGNGENLVVIREGEVPPHAPDLEPDEVVNLIPTSIDADGSVYNGIGYKTGYRMNSSGNVVEATTYVDSTLVTGYIPVKIGDIIRTYQLREKLRLSDGSYVTSNGYITFYDEKFTKLDHFNAGGYSNKALIDQGNSSWVYDESTKVTTVNIAWLDGATGVAYFRMSGMFDLVHGDTNDPADSVITVNQEIV